MLRAFPSAARRDAGRNEEPTAAVIDRQGVKTTESGGPRGYGAGKRIKGRKRHMTVDVKGLPIVVHVHAADVQDRDGALPVIEDMLEIAPTVENLIADGAYQGPKLRELQQERAVAELIEIVEKPKGAKEFTVLSRRWVVERSFAVKMPTYSWLGVLRHNTKHDCLVGRSVAAAWPRASNGRSGVPLPGRNSQPAGS